MLMVARTGGKWFVVADGQEGIAYDLILARATDRSLPIEIDRICGRKPTPKYHRHSVAQWRMLRHGNVMKAPRAQRAQQGRFGRSSDLPGTHSLGVTDIPAVADAQDVKGVS